MKDEWVCEWNVIKWSDFIKTRDNDRQVHIRTNDTLIPFAKFEEKNNPKYCSSMSVDFCKTKKFTQIPTIATLTIADLYTDWSWSWFEYNQQVQHNGNDTRVM